MQLAFGQGMYFAAEARTGKEGEAIDWVLTDSEDSTLGAGLASSVEELKVSLRNLDPQVEGVHVRAIVAAVVAARLLARPKEKGPRRDTGGADE